MRRPGRITKAISRRRSIAIGLLATCVLGASAFIGISSVSAVEPAVHFFRCELQTGGMYQFGCFRLGPPLKWEKSDIVPTAAVSVKSVDLSAFELETTVGATTVLITCTTEAGTGTVKNPEPFKSTNGEGEATLTFEGCTVAKFVACVIPGKKIVTSKLHEAAEESKTLGIGIKFTPVSGTTFAKIALGEECALGEEIVVQGSDFGKVGEEGELEFTNASSSLTVGTKEAKLRGKLEQKDEKGILVSVG